MSTFRRTGVVDTLAVTTALIFQVIILKLVSLPHIAAALISAAVLTFLVGGESPVGLVRKVRPLVVLLLVVLLARLIADYSLVSLLAWVSYASRILAAVFVALTLLGRIGSTGIRRGLKSLISPLPRRIKQPLLDLVTAALFLIPTVRRRMVDARSAATIRLSRSRTGPLRRTVMVSRAVLTALATLPPRRAEAMVVRGLVDHGPGRGPE